MMTNIGNTLLMFMANLLTLLCRPFTSALATMASAVGVNHSISVVKRMAMYAMSLCGFPGHHTVPVPNILSVSHHLKMWLAATGFYFTKMANFHPLWNRLSKGKDVGVDELGIPSGGSISTPKVSISLGIERANPKPTIPEFRMQRWNRTVLINVLPEAFLGWSAAINTRHKWPPNQCHYTTLGFW